MSVLGQDSHCCVNTHSWSTARGWFLQSKEGVMERRKGQHRKASAICCAAPTTSAFKGSQSEVDSALTAGNTHTSCGGQLGHKPSCERASLLERLRPSAKRPARQQQEQTQTHSSLTPSDTLPSHTQRRVSSLWTSGAVKFRNAFSAVTLLASFIPRSGTEAGVNNPHGGLKARRRMQKYQHHSLSPWKL